LGITFLPLINLPGIRKFLAPKLINKGLLVGLVKKGNGLPSSQSNPFPTLIL